MYCQVNMCEKDPCEMSNEDEHKESSMANEFERLFGMVYD